MTTAKYESAEGGLAIIYCRVSSRSQTKRGDGLGSQEQRCREYARYRGFKIIEVFTDDKSGSLATRPGMQAMLAFLREHRRSGHITVIIDDISRLARSVAAHLSLRAAIANAGGALESPSVAFGEDADSELHEYIMATVAQHQRRKNAEQTYNRRRGRVMNGYYPFATPLGYRHESVDGHPGKLLVRDEPLASIIQEALEGFASGRFETQGEVKRFLESHAEYPKDFADGTIRFQYVTDMLTRPVYAGMVAVPKWGIPSRKAQHEGLISIQTFQRIQERLQERPKAPVKKQIGADFALRGFVVCGDCDGPLTACWSKSSTGKKYPYYLCHNRDCPSCRKSIARDRLEGEFEQLVQALQPSTTLMQMARKMFKDAWDQRLAQGKATQAHLNSVLADLTKQADRFLERIVETDSASVIGAYEKKLAAIESEKLLIAEKLATKRTPQRSFEEMFELAMQFLASPWDLWASGHYQLRRIVLRLAFFDRVSYSRENGFSNVKLSIPFNTLRSIEGMKPDMARPKRFELLTPRFVVWCSIQLSYGRTAVDTAPVTSHRRVTGQRRYLASRRTNCKRK